MNASEMKDALRRRHPAVDAFSRPGQWTCVEEWGNIDLLAVSAWASCRPYPRYARIGYEVKVSRSDYRRELANPTKRAAAVAFCHAFYLAVPRGLLKPDEIAWTPPWGFDDDPRPLDRRRCPGAYGAACSGGMVVFGVVARRSRHDRLGAYWTPAARNYDAVCPTCRGTGWIQESAAVRAGAPRLWVPDDVGLLLVEETGRTIVAKKAPHRRATGDVVLTDAQLADLFRWVSYRPDPRHAPARAKRP